jgi:acetyltransferase-like isoleucine patch superfamily enzyme
VVGCLKEKFIRAVSAPFRHIASFMRKWIRMTLLSYVENRQHLFVGTNSCWHRGAFFNALGGISIGKNVIIGPYCVIHSANHCFDDLNEPIMFQGHVLEPVLIEDDCWLGAHVTVLPGVRLGKGCVVGAGSVVTKSMPAYSVVAGVPARIISSRLTREAIGKVVC